MDNYRRCMMCYACVVRQREMKPMRSAVKVIEVERRHGPHPNGTVLSISRLDMIV